MPNEFGDTAVADPKESQPNEFGDVPLAKAPDVNEFGDRAVGSQISPRWRVGINGKPFQTPDSIGAAPPVQTIGKQVGQGWQDINTPLVNPNTEIPKSMLPASKAGQAAVGATQGLAEFGKSFTSPLSVATLGTGAALAKSFPWISRALSGAFGAMMTKQAAETAGQLAGLPSNQRDPQTVAKSLVDIAAAGGMAALTGYDAALAKHPAAVLPKAAEEAAKPLTETEGQNASKVSPSTEIHGDVQPQPVESAGQVPVESGGGGVQPQPKEEAQSQVGQPTQIPLSLEPGHQQILKDAADEMGTSVRYKQPTDPNEPFARRIAQADRASHQVVVNPSEALEYLKKDVPKGQEEKALRSLVAHENIHLHVSDEDAAKYLATTTSAEQALANRIYVGPKGKALSPFDLGHEMLRMRMEQLAGMDVFETIQRSRKERWKVNMMLALSDAIRGARESMGTKASKEGLAILNRVSTNLDAAIRASGAVQASNATITPPEEPGASRKAYHGTPHDVDEFDTSKIGSGEGSQVFGWGLYFAEEPKVADSYRPYKEDLVDKFQRAGNRYTVAIDAEDHELLDWDKPLSQQPEQFQKLLPALQKAFRPSSYADRPQRIEDLKGSDVLNTLVQRRAFETGIPKAGQGTLIEWAKSNEAAVSKELSDLGIKGVTYADKYSRQDKTRNPTKNYVIFDPKHIKITERNGQPVTMEEARAQGQSEPGAQRKDQEPDRWEIWRNGKVEGFSRNKAQADMMASGMQGAAVKAAYGEKEILDQYAKERDAADFKELQRRMAALDINSPTIDKDFEEISRQMEAIKNRNKGYVPGTEPQEPGAKRKSSKQKEDWDATSALLQVLDSRNPEMAKELRNFLYWLPSYGETELRDLADILETESPNQERPEIERLGKLAAVKAELARKKKAGEESFPAATRKSRDQGQEEFFLPPLERGEQVERTGASEAGALPKAETHPEQDLQPEHLEWSKANAWQRLGTELAKAPYTLGKLLTKDSRAKDTDPVSMTRRVVAMERPDGKGVDVVSVYRDGAAKFGARAVDPALAGKARPNVPLSDLLAEGYKPVASMLLKEPVTNFHRRFDSLEAFEDGVGRHMDAELSKGEENPGGAEKQGDVAKAVPITQPSVYSGVNDEDLSAVHDHFRKYASAEEAVHAIADSPAKAALRNIFRKEINAELDQDPSLSREQAAYKAAERIYAETARQNRDAYIKSSVQRLDQNPLGGHGQGHAGLEQEMGTEAEGAAGEESPGAIRKSLQIAKEETDRAKEEIGSFLTGKRGREDDVARAYDAAENTPNIQANAKEFEVRQPSMKRPATAAGRALKDWTHGDPEVLAAANVLVQSDFTKQAIPQFRDLVEQGRQFGRTLTQSANWRERRLGRIMEQQADAYDKELDYAEAHWDDPVLQETAKRAKQSYAELFKYLQANGQDVKQFPAYDPQRYDASTLDQGSALLSFLRSAQGILGKRFNMERVFPTYYHAFAKGPYIPATRDIASLVHHAWRQGGNRVSRVQWQDGLKAMTMPDGEPVALEPKFLPLAQGGQRATVPQGKGGMYEVLDLGGRHMAIHKDMASLIDNLTSPSAVENWPATAAALRLSQRLKHTLLMGDFFHFGRMAYYGSAIMGKNAGFKGGWSVLDIPENRIDQAVQQGIISQRQADWGRELTQFGRERITNRELARRFVSQGGANVGKIQDALYKDLITNLSPTAGPVRKGIHAVIDPTAGRYNRFLFDGLTRGLMMEADVREFKRQQAANPNADPVRLMKDISRDVNNFFGNIGRQGWIKSKTMQDIARLLWLAPQWEEGLIKKELVGYSRLSGLSKFTGQRQGLSPLGTTGRGIGRGLLFLFGLTQAINLYTQRRFTWQNPGDDKWNAILPEWGGDGRELRFSPLGVFNEMTDNLWQYSKAKPSVLQAADQIAGNKESPLARAALITAGMVPSNEPRPTSSLGQIGMAAKQLAPVPITFGAFGREGLSLATGGRVAPPTTGQLIQRALGSAGLKTHPKPSLLSQTYENAQKFAVANGYKPETGWEEMQTDQPGYSKLRAAIRLNDTSEAKEQFDAMVATHGGGKQGENAVFKAMRNAAKRPFTGSAKAERAFLHSLSDKELADYQKAEEQRLTELDKFWDFVAKLPEK